MFSFFDRSQSSNNGQNGNGNSSNGSKPTSSSNEDYLIELKGIQKEFKTDAGPFLALKGIDLQIKPGEFVGVIGKSGSGKSTMINMITGIDRPTAGEVWVNGTPIHKFSENKMAKWRGTNMGVVFQFFQLLPTLTVIENVMLPMDFGNKYSSRERVETAMEILSLMDVADQAHKLPTMISGGQQQRVAIARALANDPPIIVADEPTGNLDSKTAAQVFDLFQKLVEQGKTFLMVTHDDDLAGQLTRVITISDGLLDHEDNRPIQQIRPVAKEDKKVEAPQLEEVS